MNFQGDLVFNADKPQGQKRSILDTSRAEQELGFKAITDLKTGLATTIKFYGH